MAISIIALKAAKGSARRLRSKRPVTGALPPAPTRALATGAATEPPSGRYVVALSRSGWKIAMRSATVHARHRGVEEHRLADAASGRMSAAGVDIVADGFEYLGCAASTQKMGEVKIRLARRPASAFDLRLVVTAQIAGERRRDPRILRSARIRSRSRVGATCA